MRLIATDLDGTIVRHDGTVSERTSAALHAARDAGIGLVLVTGRPFRWLDGIRASLGDIGTTICANGALVYDAERGEVIEAETMDVGTVMEARARVLALAPDASFAAETTGGLHVELGFAEREGIEAGDFDEDALRREGVVKLLARRAGGTCREFDELVSDRLDGLVTVTHSAPGIPLIEMSAPGVDKAATLARHAARLGVDAAEVVAFGDMPNDVGMLRWAGTSYAVGHGQPDVVAAADHVIGTVEEDSVARVVEELLARRGARA